MNFKQKKGISLIVLVITIIVMIILASAVILSLSGAGIIGKANEAKTASDNANKKQAAAVLYSEWLLANSQGETEKTARAYIKDGLVDMGLDASDVAVTDDGEILTGLTEVAVTLVEENVAVGTVVTGYELPAASTVSTTPGQEYTISLLTSTASAATYTAPAKVTAGIAKGVTTAGTEKTIKAMPDLTWRYMGIDDKGNALITPDIPVPDGKITENDPKYTLVENRGNSDYTLGLGYEGGFLYGAEIINEACDTLYTTEKGKARSWTLEDVWRVLDYSGPKYAYTYCSAYVPTTSPMTVESIMSSRNLLVDNFTSTYTPSSTDNDTWAVIKNYKSNRFTAEYFDFTSASDNALFIVFGDPDTNKDGVIDSAELTEERGNANYWLADQMISFNHQADNNGTSPYLSGDLAYGIGTVGSEGEQIGYVQLVHSTMDATKRGVLNYRVIRPVVELAGTLGVEIGETVELKNVQ